MLGHHLGIAQRHVLADHVQGSVPKNLLEAEDISPVQQVIDSEGVFPMDFRL